MSCLFYLVLSVLCYSTYGHIGCGTDKIKHFKIHKNMNVKPIETKSTHDDYRMQGRAQDPLPSAIYNNIRIHYNTTQLQHDWSSYSKLSYFMDDVIPAAQQWIQKVISVRPVNGDLTFQFPCTDVVSSGPNVGKCTYTNAKCGAHAFIPSSMFDAHEVCTDTSCQVHGQGNGMSNTDVIIYVTGQHSVECDNVFAYAGFCHSNSNDRPIAGHLNLCKATMDVRNVFAWEQSVALIIHETFHVLGFISNGFTNFKYENGSSRTDVTQIINKRGADRVVVTLPTVVEKAKEFFDCSSMDGIELENSGGSMVIGSHWDERILLNDIMISTVRAVLSYSMFTLAVLSDSGWYHVDWDYAQIPTDGRNKGCTWYNDACIDGDVNTTIDDASFCTSDVWNSCSSLYTGGFYCAIEQYTSALPSEMQYWSSDPRKGGSSANADYCPSYVSYSNSDCRLWGENNIGIASPDAVANGGFISGKSKCALLGGTISPFGIGCYPTECFTNHLGEYVGTRITMYKDYTLNDFHVMTCWAGVDDGVVKPFAFQFSADANWGWDQIYCPRFHDICYDENPWICNGHGTIKNGVCICSPGYFGMDCTIENNAVNRVQYSDSDSVSVYDEKVCKPTMWDQCNGDATTCDDDHVGILSVVIDGISASTYVEQYFQSAVQNWMAILMDISKCNVDIRDYIYSNDAASMDIYYYATDTTFNDVSTTQTRIIFSNLFGDEMNHMITELTTPSNVIAIQTTKETNQSGCNCSTCYYIFILLQFVFAALIISVM